MRVADSENICCPKCKNGLSVETTTMVGKQIHFGELVCQQCHRSYSIENDIVHTYVDDDCSASSFDNSAEQIQFGSLVSFDGPANPWTENNSQIGNRTNLADISGTLHRQCLVLRFIAVSIFLVSFIFAFIEANLALIFLFIASLISFLDYVIYRTEAKNSFEVQAQALKRMLAKGEVEQFYSKRKTDKWFGHLVLDKTTHDIDTVAWNMMKKQLPPPIQDYYRLDVAQAFKKAYRISGKKVLDLGCGTGEIVQIYSQDNDVIGVDLNETSLHFLMNKVDVPAFQADAAELPFKDNVFDLVSFTETIEHMPNPLQALLEIKRVLRTGGLLLLTTNSRNLISFFGWLNPFMVAERSIGLYWDRLLPSRNLMATSDDEEMNYYHTDFSKQEITSLLASSGFLIEHVSSYAHFYGLERVFQYVFLTDNETFYRKFARRYEPIVQKIPFLKSLGYHWIVVARKPGEYGSC